MSELPITADQADADGSRYHYRGDLAQESLPEILFAVHRYRVPGVIQATCEGVVKRIFVKDGNIVHAASSNRQESLGHFLHGSGNISREDFLATMRERSRTDTRYGVLLVERQVLSPADLYRAIRLQSAEIVWDLFSWREGDVTFRVGQFPEPWALEIQIPVRQAIKEGVKRIADVRSLLQRIGGRDVVLEPCHEIEDLIEVALRTEEYDLLKLVDGHRSLYQLCAEGPFDSATNGKLLYAFHVLRFVRKSGQPETPTGGIKLRLSSSNP